MLVILEGTGGAAFFAGVVQMRFFSFASVAFLAGAFFATAMSWAHASILIAVDKTTQRMTVMVDGVRRYEWPVSTGRSGYSTPTGTFVPFRMELDYFSKQWDDAPMPHSIFFTTIGHAIHGSLDVRHLGKPVSHGCVRISPENATTLWDLVTAEGLPNTKVIITGPDPGARGPVALVDDTVLNPNLVWRPGYVAPGEVAPVKKKKKKPAYLRYYNDLSFPRAN